ncbi:hypothetical protein ACLILW_17820 [Shewanella baltica]|uniref:hypothetical protein n=1 Tax=Shewanella baltica TaxID=62322 RepID=UPI003984CE09
MNNIYLQLMGKENDLCMPVMDVEYLQGLPMYAAQLAGLGEGTKIPKIILDLEQIQVLDYTSISTVSDEQINVINDKLKKIPPAPDELAFLALKSLYTYAWCEIETQKEFESAIETEQALNYLITKQAMELASDIMYQDAKLPYWIRLSQLRVMSKIPQDVISSGKLDKVACYPIKSLFFNANSTMFRDGTDPLIGFNYTLEPILKMLNRIMIHFYSSQHLAGEIRIQRAWKELLPIVKFLLGTTSAYEVTPNAILFSVEDAQLAQNISADQVDFIMLHELGHILNNHPFQLDELKGTEGEVESRHKLELNADSFAHQVYKKWLLLDDDESLDFKLGEYANLIEGSQLLFIYMNFLEFAKDKVASFSNVSARPSLSDTHPSASLRLEHLNALTGIKSRSDRVGYATKLFQQIIDYVTDASEEEVLSDMSSLRKEA